MSTCTLMIKKMGTHFVLLVFILLGMQVFASDVNEKDTGENLIHGDIEISFYNWPGKKSLVKYNARELLSEVAHCNYVLKVAHIKDTIEVGPISARITRTFFITDIIRGNIPPNICITVEYFPEITPEVKDNPKALQTITYDIDEGYLFLSDNNLIISNDSYNIDYSEAYYYQFFIYGGDTKKLIKLIRYTN